MAEVWLLFEERNVARRDEEAFFGPKKSYRVFAKFEDAVRAIRNLGRAHTYIDNEIFNGEERIRAFEEYIDRVMDDPEKQYKIDVRNTCDEAHYIHIELMKKEVE